MVAGILEVVWACAMKRSNGFEVFAPSVIAAAGYIASAVFLALALRRLPLGTAYAMWTGFGIAGTSLLGAVLFHEKLSSLQIICIIMIIISIACLKMLEE